jgi:hypothetical protein
MYEMNEKNEMLRNFIHRLINFEMKFNFKHV